MAGTVTRRKFRDYNLARGVHDRLGAAKTSRGAGRIRAFTCSPATRWRSAIVLDSISICPARQVRIGPSWSTIRKSPQSFQPRRRKATRVFCGSVFHLSEQGAELVSFRRLFWQTLDIDFKGASFRWQRETDIESGHLGEGSTGARRWTSWKWGGPTPHGFKGPEAPDGPIWFEGLRTSRAVPQHLGYGNSLRREGHAPRRRREIRACRRVRA